MFVVVGVFVGEGGVGWGDGVVVDVVDVGEVVSLVLEVGFEVVG